VKRRRFLQSTGAAAMGVGIVACNSRKAVSTTPPGPKPVVSILRARSYSDELLDVLRRGAEQCGLDARGKRVLLKPNLVEFDSATTINTNVALIAAAFELFRGLGAAEVRIGEGPGHRRDSLYLAEVAGYRKGVERFDTRFVDLNRDDVAPAGPFGSLENIYLPATVLGADLVVSLAKMKTHHWVGATLSMKNFFGVVPGSLYGWPKNQLHQIGIPRSIAELHRIFGRKSFGIVDGVVGMQGNGPIRGTPLNAGVIVMGADLAAVDATCCRIMGIDPQKVDYLQLAASAGSLNADSIEQRGERLDAVRCNFDLIPQFQNLRI